ncbi:hypothetical protein EAF00_007683 [Botryotinia globosa]|nr:hypothetical protein EAF00_007683 [Botryotinia globosa]
MESSSRSTGDLGFIHGREMKSMGGYTLKRPSQATTSTFTPNSTLKPSSSPSPSHLKSSTPASYSNSKPPTTSSNTFSNFPFSSTTSRTAPKISITTTIDSLISNHQNRNVGLLLMTQDLVASPVEDFILGSPLEGFM